jgi:uncharacterized small protein (DUF1192 family)
VVCAGITGAAAFRPSSAAETEASAAAPPAQAGEVAPGAGSPADIAALRQEVAALRAEIESLKAALAAMQQQGAAGAPAAGGTPPTPAPGAPVAQGTAPARSQNVMNPAISAVFQAIGQSFVDGREDANGFDLSEAEVAFESVVDPYAKMNLYLTFPVDESPEVEEGYAQTLALPASLQLKGGRFKEAFGKWNTLHTHAFPTVERPEVLVNYFGEESLTNDGLSLSWLIPNKAGLYLESVSEAGTAREGVSFNSEARALTWSERLSAFFNPSSDATLEVGLSTVGGQTGPTDALLAGLDAAGLTGIVVPDERLPSQVNGVDLTWKWKPLQANTYRSFTAQAEALRSRRHVETLAGTTLEEDTVASAGGYLYLESQWTKRWKVGLRGDLSGYPDSETDRLWGVSGVARFSPSEFQEFRFQVKRTRSNEGAAARTSADADQEDTRVYFEWIPIIGAHGAHKY